MMPRSEAFHRDRASQNNNLTIYDARSEAFHRERASQITENASQT